MDFSGDRSAASLLRKGVDLVLDVARQKGATEPVPLLEAARRTLHLFEEASYEPLG